MKKLPLFLMTGLMLTALSGSAWAVDRFVDANNGNDNGGANDCSDSNAPCLTIQNAIDNATPGDDIFLEPGTYDQGGGTDTIVVIDKDLSLFGTSALDTFIDGNGSDRGVAVEPDVTALISGVTVRNGNDGGTGDEGAGIRNFGTLTLRDSVVTSSSNQGNDGAGIFNGKAPGGLPGGVMTIVNSTISGNTGGGSGGGIANGGQGIGDPDYTGDLVMINSTISGNTSSATDADEGGGGLYNHVGSVAKLFNVSILQNTNAGPNSSEGGGGVLNEGSLEINNTLIAGNVDNSPASANDCEGDLSSTHGHNLVEDPTGCNLSGNSAGNVTGVDPLAGALTLNGGSTPTHALLANSPAIDAGDPAGCKDDTGTVLDEDQRGSARPVAGIENGTPRCDIGAFEAAAGTTPNGGGSGNGGGCSLLHASPSMSSFGGLVLLTMSFFGMGLWRRMKG